MEKYDDLNEFSSVLNEEIEMVENRKAGLDAISAIGNSFMKLKPSKIVNLISYRATNRSNVMEFADEASDEEKSESASKLNNAVMSGENAIKEINNYISDLAGRKFEHERDITLSNMLNDKMNGALDDLKAKVDLGRDLLNKNEISKKHNNKEVNLDNAPIFENNKEDDLKINESVENAEKVESTENVQPGEFEIQPFNVDELNNSIDEELQNQNIITDSIEENEQSNDNIEINDNVFESENNDLAHLLNTDELDRALDEVSNDKKQLTEAQNELNSSSEVTVENNNYDNMLKFPFFGEQSHPVIEDSTNDNMIFESIGRDSKIDPVEDGFIHVDKIESALNNTNNYDEVSEKTYAKVA